MSELPLPGLDPYDAELDRLVNEAYEAADLAVQRRGALFQFIGKAISRGVWTPAEAARKANIRPEEVRRFADIEARRRRWDRRRAKAAA